MPFVPSKNKLGNIKPPSTLLNRAQQQLGRVLGDRLRKPKAVRLGNPETGELFVEDDKSLVYISGYGDEADGVTTMPRAGIPREYLKAGQTITVKKQKNAFAYVGIDIDTGGIFNEGIEDQHDQTPISIAQLDFATLQPYSAMVAVVKGAIYGDDSVIDLLTADFSASPDDILSNPIDIPTNNNRAIGVLVQLDSVAKTLSYKQSAEFNASLSLAQAYDSGLLPLRDTGLWRIGYIRLIAGMTALDNSTIWTCPEFFPVIESLTGNTGSVDNAVLVADGTGGSTLKATDVIIDSNENMTALNSLAFLASSELTIASGAVTITSAVHRIDTEANTASDDLDTINGGTASRFLVLYAENTARTVVIRHNGGGTGNIRTFTGTSITLDETYKYVLLMYDSTNSVWGVIDAGGGTIIGSTGSIDNSLIRADSIDGKTIQSSSVTMGDTGVISGGIQIGLNATTNNKLFLGGEVTKTISSGEITSGNDRNISVSAESGTSDDLIGIIGAFNSGEVIYLRAASGHIITVKHDDAGATNDIHLVNNTDIVLDELNTLALQFVGGGHFSANLVPIGGSSNFGAGVIKTLSGDVVAAGTDRHLIIAAESGTTDNLKEVTGLNVGDTIYLRADAGDTITIQHNSGSATDKFFCRSGNIKLDENYPTIFRKIASGKVQQEFLTGIPYLNPNSPSDLSIPYFSGTAGLIIASAALIEGDGRISGVSYPSGTNDVAVLGWVNAQIAKHAILTDEKSSGTAGGSSSNTTWNARDLNTERYDASNLVTITSNTFRPIAGDYEFDCFACAGTAATTMSHRLRLFNIDAAVVVVEGLNARSPGGRFNTSLHGAFTANGTDDYRIDHYTETGLATSGLGVAMSLGTNEVYLELRLRKTG